MRPDTNSRQEITTEDLDRYDSQAARLFKALLAGVSITRLDLKDRKIAPNRSDLSALVCKVEQQFMVPVERERVGKGLMKRYWISQNERRLYERRFDDPGRRERQRQRVLLVASQRRQEWCLAAAGHLATDFLKTPTVAADRLSQAGEKLITASKVGEPIAGGRPAIGHTQSHSISNVVEDCHGPRFNK